ncbi:hypothetical protein NKG05_13070 [Oerskovia sp. M15]
MTEIETRTLEVPGATMTYDIRGDLSAATDGSRALLLIGSPMGAEGFGTLASHFTDRPVVTYDPRGSRAASAPTSARSSTPSSTPMTCTA